MADTTPMSPTTWAEAATDAVRRLAATTAAGALLGLLVGGVGGRLAMLLLARLNPSATGVISDDDFEMGRFTASGTLNLLVVATVLGALGAALYTVLRPLLLGPRWFRVLCIGLGPAVVVGERLVHVDGVDFTRLSPAWLAIALFLVIPGVYAALLTIVAERWRPPRGPFARVSLPVALLPLIAFGPLAPLLIVLAGGWVVLEAVRRRRHGELPFATAAAWGGRALLAVLFCVALVRLVAEARQLI